MNCRWCRFPKAEVLPGMFICQRGCAEKPIHTGQCIDCGRTFETGRAAADQCPSCEVAEDARYRREAEGDTTAHTGYTRDMRARGASQRAYEMGKRRVKEAFSFVCDNGAGGKLQLSVDQRRGLDMFLSMHPGARMEATFKVWRATRSNAQNRFWWGVVVPVIAEHLGYQNDELHEALKLKFLALDAEPDAHGLQRVRGTSTLNTKEFTDLIENVVTWAGAEFGIVIPMPDELKKAG